MVFDLLVTDGRVYDGSGNPWTRMDIAIKESKISALGRLRKIDAKRTIDASRLVVCPGFIDPHTHSEITLLVNNKAESAVRQGITLQATGNCGSSCAPIVESERQHILGSEFADELQADWSSFGQYLDRLERNGLAINAASLFGHGTIRTCTMGEKSRRPTNRELDAMKNLVAESMVGGAFGMSVGLSFYPGGYADTEELVQLSRVVAAYGGVYFSHGRGSYDESVRETIEIGEKARIPVHPVHSRPIIHGFQGKVEDVLSSIDEARERGVDFTCDVYPYSWASSGLYGMLPPWVFEGGIEKTIERLKDPQTWERIKVEMLDPKMSLNLGFIAKHGTWDKVILLHHNKSKEFIEKNILEMAAMMNVEPIDVVRNLILAEGDDPSGLPTIQQVITEELLLRIFKHPSTMVGSDGRALSPYGILGGKLVHPRSYGAYPRILGRWVREEVRLSMEEAIRKMTSLPAQTLGIQDRGLIRKDMWADLVLFDAETIMDSATFEAPHQYPRGIQYVIVNGQTVIENGEHSGRLPGRVLRGPGYGLSEQLWRDE